MSNKSAVTELECDHCGELIEEEIVRRGDKTYCSEACAFEATRSKDCSGRSDSIIPHEVVDPAKI